MKGSVCLQVDRNHPQINQSLHFVISASANQSTESLPHPSHNSAPLPQHYLSPYIAHAALPAPNNLPRVLGNPALLRQSPPPPPPPPRSLWPPPDQPVFSLANAISLAMSVAHSFLPPAEGARQSFPPPASLSLPLAAPSPPVSLSLGSTFDPSSPTSFAGPFSSSQPYSTPRPQTSPASSKQEAPDWTVDKTQVGQVTLPVEQPQMPAGAGGETSVSDSSTSAN